MTSETLDEYARKANSGEPDAVKSIMEMFGSEMTLEESRQLDFALSKVTRPESVEVIKEYLFKGSKIQRNYAALYLGRIHEYIILKEAFDQGLIDDKQAFSR